MTLVAEESIDVPLPPDRAFRLFTEGIARWWPLETHSVSASGDHGEAARHVAMEPVEGGRVTETLASGESTLWATVTRYDPPRALELRWHPGRSEDIATRVTVLFEEAGEGTRVTVRHDGFEVLDDAAASAMRDGYASGWPRVLACFASRACTPLAAET